MNIVVPIKLVPDLVEELELNEGGTDLDRDFLSLRINEFCDHAIEEALQLKEAHAGHVTVLALDGEETEKVLFTALAKGADRAIKVKGLDEDEAHTTAQVAAAMKEAISGLEWDVILTGVQAPDDLDGQLGVRLGAMLGVPAISVVSGIEFDGGKWTVLKEYAGGVAARFEVDGKAVFGVQAARETPRYAPVSRVRQIMKERSLDEIEVEADAGSAAPSVRRMYAPEGGERAEMIEGSTEEVAERIAAILRERRG